MVYKICKGCNELKQIYSGGYCRPCYKSEQSLSVDLENYDKEKVRPSIMHIYIHSKLKENCEFNSNKLSREIVKVIFFKGHIPKICYNDFLCEMEELGMIKFKDKRNIEIVV